MALDGEDLGPSFKYTLESALIVNCGFAGLVSPADLESLSKQADGLPRCQIYAIAHRPRVTVSKGSFSCDLDRMSMVYQSDWGDGEPATVQVELPNIFQELVSLEVEAGGSSLRFVREDGETRLEGPAGVLLGEFLRGLDPRERSDAEAVDGNLLDLKVCYVGQSGDPNGAAQRRLLSHNKLQQILADVNRRKPYLEVWVVLMAFDSHSSMTTFGPWASEMGWEESIHHWTESERTAHELEDTRRTNLVEAALIRYFQPEYNVMFVDSFPDDRHATYEFAYEVDYNAVGFELETLSTISCRLWTDVAEPTFIHSRLFPLHAAEDRLFLLDPIAQDLSGIVIKPQDRPARGH